MPLALRKYALAPVAAVGILACALFAAKGEAAATETVTNLNDSGAGSLRAAVANVDSGGTITFGSSLSGTIPLQSAIAIDKSLTIDGNGQVAVSGRNFNQVFQVGEVTPAIDVAMDDLEITRGSSENGADSTNDGCGIHSEISGSLSFDRMLFFRNNGECVGGGFQHNGTGPVTVIDSEFARNNTNDQGGAFAILAEFGSPNDADLTVTNSLFRLNAADDGGGAILTDGRASDGSTVITDSLFVDNSGGADGEGGHIFHDDASGDLKVERTRFLGGGAIDDPGGAIRVYDADGVTFILRDVDITRVGATAGAALHFNNADSTYVFERLTVVSTLGGEECAGIAFESSELESFLLKDSALVNNMCGDSAAVFWATTNGDYEIVNTTIAGNGGDGESGAVWFLNNQNLLIDGSTIAGNTTASGDSKPGGIRLTNDVNLTMRNSILADNISGGRPGLSDCYDQGGNTTITLEGANIIGDVGNCTFEAGSTTPITGDAGLAAEPVEVPNASGNGTTWVVPLLASSPAIDAAVGSDLDFDQRGVARPQLQAADIGAYEFAPGPTVALSGKAGLRSVKAKVGCGNQQACTVSVQGIRDLPARTDDPKTKARTISIAKGATKTVKLAYTRYMRNSIYRSLRKNRKPKFALVATNTQSGSTSSKTVRVKVKLKPRKSKRRPINP